MTSNSADSSLLPDTAGEPSVRMAVDVRRFPWIRRLAADYAYDFPCASRRFSPAIRRPRRLGRRDRAHAGPSPPSQRHRGGHRGAAGAPRRAAPRARSGAPACRSARPSRSSPASRPGSSADRCSRCSRRSRRSSSPNRSRAITACPAVAIFWIDAEDHDWDEVRSCTVFDDEPDAAHGVALPPRPAGDPRAGRDRRARRLDQRRARRARTACCPPPNSAPRLLADLRAAYSAGHRHGGRVRPLARTACSATRGLVVYDSSDPASKPLAQQRVRARAVHAGPDGEARGARRLGPRGARAITRRCTRRTTASRCSTSTAADGGRSASRTASSSSAISSFAPAALVQQAAERPAGVQPERAAPPDRAGHALPDDLLRRRTERARLSRSAARRLRALRRADAADVSARDRDAARFGGAALPRQVQAAARGAAGAGRSGAERAARRRRSRQRSRTSFAERVDGDRSADGAADRRRCRRSTRRSKARRDRRSSRMQHDLQTLHSKMIQAAKRRDETLRRQFIRARALAFPDGHAQERTIGFVSFLNQYGPALVESARARPVAAVVDRGAKPVADAGDHAAAGEHGIRADPRSLRSPPLARTTTSTSCPRRCSGPARRWRARGGGSRPRDRRAPAPPRGSAVRARRDRRGERERGERQAGESARGDHVRLRVYRAGAVRCSERIRQRRAEQRDENQHDRRQHEEDEERVAHDVARARARTGRGSAASRTAAPDSRAPRRDRRRRPPSRGAPAASCAACHHVRRLDHPFRSAATARTRRAPPSRRATSGGKVAGVETRTNRLGDLLVEMRRR